MSVPHCVTGRIVAVEPPTRDLGLQSERTALSWLRTTLSHAGLTLLLVRWVAAGGGSAALVVPAVMTFPVFAIISYVSWRSRLRLRDINATRAMPAAVTVSAAAVFVAAVFALAVVAAG